jgi:hypothetical protein
MNRSTHLLLITISRDWGRLSNKALQQMVAVGAAFGRTSGAHC